jgi:hypothetical protein
MSMLYLYVRKPSPPIMSMQYLRVGHKLLSIIGVTYLLYSVFPIVSY